MTLHQVEGEDLVQKLFADLSAGYGGVMVSIGHKLGLYRVLSNAGPMSSEEVALRAGCAERYVREWLKSQVAGGYLLYHPKTATYELTPEQARILADDESPVFLPHAWQVVASMWSDEEKALKAFRSGEGIAWGDHDERLYCGVAAFFRNSYRANLLESWLPALTSVVDKLEEGALVADVGCGQGHSTLLMAEAFPNSHFWGFDTHAQSVRTAARLAESSGLGVRASFARASATDYPKRGYDLICFFDCLHDMGRPLDAARHAHKALAEDGSLVLVEPFAADRLEENINPVGRLYYAASTTLCCAHAISEKGTHVLGAQAGEKMLGEILRTAGFRDIRRAAETPFNLVIEARR